MKRVQSPEFCPEYQDINNTMVLLEADCALFFSLLLEKQYWKGNVENPHLLNSFNSTFNFSIKYKDSRKYKTHLEKLI